MVDAEGKREVAQKNHPTQSRRLRGGPGRYLVFGEGNFAQQVSGEEFKARADAVEVLQSPASVPKNEQRRQGVLPGFCAMRLRVF